MAVLISHKTVFVFDEKAFEDYAEGISLFAAPLYEMEYLCGEPYLFPLGRAVAEHAHAIRLNETSAWLYERFREGGIPEQLLSLAESELSLEEQDKESFLRDATSFRDVLQKMQALSISSECDKEQRKEHTPVQLEVNDDFQNKENLAFQSNVGTPRAVSEYLYIAGMQIGIRAAISDFQSIPLVKELLDFKVSAAFDHNISIQISKQPKAFLQAIESRGKLIFETDELSLYELQDGYFLWFTGYQNLLGAYLKKAQREAAFFVSNECVYDEKQCAEELYHALRFIFLYYAEQRGMMAIHSASFLYRDEAWLVAAPSGTGKTTLTNHLLSLYPAEVALINGDMNLYADGKIYGTPWHGTSGVYMRQEYSLGGIILLQRGGACEALEAEKHEKALGILQRCISPILCREQLRTYIACTEEMMEQDQVIQYACTKESEAGAQLYHLLEALS